VRLRHSSARGTKRFPWVAEAALKNRQKQFVIDGEAVILGINGYSDWNAVWGQLWGQQKARSHDNPAPVFQTGGSIQSGFAGDVASVEALPRFRYASRLSHVAH
jgi:hypothetical protein